MLHLIQRHPGSLCGLLLAIASLPGTAAAQFPNSIQIFVPNGGLPEQAIRFTLTRDDGRIETLFTDTKGKFLLTGDLVRDADYTITVESDGRTFDTTTTRFRIIRGTPVYATVFLRPLTSKSKPPPGVIDVASLQPDVPSGARNAYDEAIKAVGKGKVDDAITNFRSALKQYPQYLRALNDFGVLYLKLDRLEEAGELFEKAIKVNAKYPNSRLNLGVVLNRQANFKRAAEVLGGLYEENPSLHGLALPYADALAGKGDLAKSEKVLRAALQATGADNTTLVELHFKLGLILNREERFADAADELQKAIALDPNAATAHLLLGGSLLQLNRLPEAEKELVRAYELGGPALGTAQMFLGQLYLMQQKPEAALRAFEQYLNDVPAAANSAQVKAEIEKLKSALNKK
jgi:Flp pilus assembly protein TadD